MKDGLPEIIAEIGLNHEGDRQAARAMIEAAPGAGADAVKFQDLSAGRSWSGRHRRPGTNWPPAPWTGRLIFSWPKSRRMRCRIPVHRVFAPGRGPFGTGGRAAVQDRFHGPDKFRPAGVRGQNRQAHPAVHGHGDSGGNRRGRGVSSGHGNRKSDLLHCVSHYPARAEDLNLGAIGILKKAFDLPVGYSDHFPGVKACVAAALAGAEVLETHFTLDNTGRRGPRPFRG